MIATFTLLLGLAGAAAGLSPHQQALLAQPARPPLPGPYSLDDPAGSVFSADQQRAQRQAAATVVPLVAAAYRSGVASVRIPPGDYRFGQETWGPHGPIYPLEFAGLRRNAARPLVIDATGATFWFELGDEQAPTAHFCLAFRDCANVTLRGATLARATRGNIEGRITRLDPAANRIEIRLAAGCALPTKFSGGMEQRLVPFKSDGRFCAPLYALQAGGMHLKYRDIVPSDRPGHAWVTMLDRTLLTTLADPRWQAVYGEALPGVGDGLSCLYTVSVALSLIDSANLTMDGVRVHVTKGAGIEDHGDGGHLWKDCYFGPPPGTNQWQGGDGFLLNGTRAGTTWDGMVVRHTTDDIANFHGYTHLVKSTDGPQLTLSPNSETRRTLAPGAVAGDRLLFWHKRTGRRLGQAVITALDGDTITVDQPVAGWAEALVEWPDHESAGWSLRRCDFADCYQRVMIQSGPGEIRDCRFARIGSAVELNSVFPYVEGGVPHHITIAGNSFVDANPQPGGAAIACWLATFGQLEVPLPHDVAITGNTFRGSGGPAIWLRGCAGVTITDNRFEANERAVMLQAPAAGHSGPVWTDDCVDVTLR